MMLIKEFGLLLLVSVTFNDVMFIIIITDQDLMILNVSTVSEVTDSKQSVIINAVKTLVIELLDHLVSFSSYLQQVIIIVRIFCGTIFHKSP